MVMLKRILAVFLTILVLAPAVLADQASDQAYINKLDYQRNKLTLVAKTRVIGETSSYSSTNIDTTSYTLEAYTQTYGNISTSSLQRQENKEITDWFIYKGTVRKLSDLDLLQLVGDQDEYRRVYDLDSRKAQLRMIGNISIGVGALVMIGGAGLSAGQPTITGGALVMVTGFFISAFNLAPHHYIQPDFAKEKIDNYNLALKKKLNLPLEYE